MDFWALEKQQFRSPFEDEVESLQDKEELLRQAF
jgi:hypothetical protein